MKGRKSHNINLEITRVAILHITQHTQNMSQKN